MITGHEYLFSYMTNKTSLTYDGMNLIIKQGPFRTTTIPMMSVLNWYLYEDKTYRSLFITYTHESGKQKKVQLFAQLGEPGFAALIEGMNAALGQKGLNHLDKKEAFKIMKTADPKKVGALAAMIIVFALTTTVMLPGLLHFFDFGFDDEVFVEELIAGEYESRNMTLYGYPLEETLEETYTKGSTTTITYYIPIVGEDWEYGDQIDVIMKFSEDDYYNADEESVAFTGVARNIWYEGLDSDEKEFFNTEYGFEVSEDVIMFEATGDERNGGMEFFIWCLINGIFLVIFVVMLIRSK
jgi:hypothetical protein